MPATHDNQESRWAALRRILARDRVTSQRQLVERLEGDGFAVTQSSVSRDLRELGVAKVRGRYLLPEAVAGNGAPAAVTAPEQLVQVRRVRLAGASLVVVHTEVGGAAGVALRLDQLAWPEVIGTVAGDDTVFVAVADRRQQRSFLQRLESLLPVELATSDD